MRDVDLADLSLDFACVKAAATFGLELVKDGSAFPVVVLG